MRRALSPRRRLPLKRSKYNVDTSVAGRAKRTRGGYTYDSQREAKHAATLETLARAADPSERVTKIERQVTVPLNVNGEHITNYRCDFRVTFADGREEWHEVKGLATDLWRVKERLFRALYPERALKVIR